MTEIERYVLDEIDLLRRIVDKRRIVVYMGRKTWCEISGQLPPLDEDVQRVMFGFPVVFTEIHDYIEVGLRK